jgi:hypothetical protein
MSTTIALIVNHYLFIFVGVLLAKFILVADYSHGRIMQVDLRTGHLVKLPISIRTVPGIAFDITSKEIFYSDTSTKTIMSTTLHGRNVSLFFTTGSPIVHEYRRT